MPHVIVDRNADIVSDQLLVNLFSLLAKIIAEELTDAEDEQTKVTPEEIEIRVRDAGPIDFNCPTFCITINANHYPGRAKNLKERACAIARRFEEDTRMNFLEYDLVLGPDQYVWIRLAEGGFESFKQD